MAKQRWGVVAALAALTLFAVACSDVNDDDTNSPAGGSGSAVEVPDNSGTTIDLAISPWTGSEANVAVAQVLLQDQLGYSVETTKIDEYAQFPALANGQLSATLEIWPSGHAKDYKKYIEGDAGVVDGGELGVIGQIGWWIPTYMLNDYPELATWEGLKTNADLFKTAESGDQGQILDGDPSFVTFDQPIADNLGLDLKVVYGGSEAAELAALDAAVQKEDPILMYFWTPHWAQQKYDLTMIQLPDVTEACEEAAANDASQYACAYPEDDLYKAFNADLQTDAPAAFAMLSAMSYTNDDQNSIALDINNGMSPEEAAQTWIDANPDVWQPWVDAGLSAS
jgi:glycine betaine/proline transport system substrate-binding protein